MFWHMMAAHCYISGVLTEFAWLWKDKWEVSKCNVVGCALVVQSGAIQVSGSFTNFSFIFTNLMFFTKSHSQAGIRGFRECVYRCIIETGHESTCSVNSKRREKWWMEKKTANTSLGNVQERTREVFVSFFCIFLQMSVCISACFFYLVSIVFFRRWLGFGLDYIWFNLLKAMCDLTTERAACGNGGRKASEMLAVWLLKGCRKENWRKSAKERGCSWREGKLEKRRDKRWVSLRPTSVLGTEQE